MRTLSTILLIGLCALGLVACGSETPTPTNTAVPASPTSAPTRAPDTPTPEPTATPAPTLAPTTAPQPTATRAPTAVPEPTDTPQPSPTPEPTAAPQPTATATATAMPEPTATPEPTSTPEPTPTAEPTQEPEPPIATTLAPLGDNLLWVAFFDSRTQSLSAYDPSGTFSPEMALPPGQEAPDPSEIGQLTELTSGKIYFFSVSQKQTVELDGNVIDFFQGGNQIFWK